jgi:hypothetical protein
MYLLHDSALVDHGRPAFESHHPVPIMGAGNARSLRKTTSGHSWIARWSSWLFCTEIHVSPMSDTWLRAHEDDSTKHGLHI